MKQQSRSYGIYDRFPHGCAWYDSIHTTTQVQGIKNAQAQMTFYSSAQFTTSNERTRGAINRNKVIKVRE